MLQSIIKYFLFLPRHLRKKLLKSNAKTYFIYGTGDPGLEFYTLMKQDNLIFKGWFDIKANKEKYNVLGMEVLPTEKMKDISDESYIVICSLAFTRAMLDECKKNNVPANRVISWINDNE